MECDRRDLLRAGLAAGAWAAGCSSAPTDGQPVARDARASEPRVEPHELDSNGCEPNPRESSDPASHAGEPRSLEQWIAHGRTLSPVYGGGLANHLPMALYALSELGATRAQIDAFATRYARMLVPLEPGASDFGEREWRAHVGDAGALAPLVRGFDAWVERDGAEHVLRAALPVLVSGIAAAGWHGLIRTAYGWRFRDAHEVAHGLAYWTSSYVELGPLPPPRATPVPTALELFECARATPSLACRPSARGGIVGRMQPAVRLDGFAELANALRIDDATLAGMACAAALVFASSRDFTALHACTATQALRVLAPLFADEELALRRHGQALLAAYVGIGAPNVCMPACAPPSWDELVARACASSDDHDIKLTDALRDEERAHGDGAWRAAVAARLG